MLHLYKRRGTDEHNLLKPTFNSQEELNSFLMEASKILSRRGETCCTRIANARFYDGYAPVKKWVIVASIASSQSRDFKRYIAQTQA